MTKPGSDGHVALKVDAAMLKTLSRLQPLRTARALAFDWIVIATLIVLSEFIDSVPAYLMAVILIAGRMHALGVLMHEFSHFRFIQNKRLSDWICDLTVSWPLFTTVNGYRINHAAHHRYTNTELDPDWIAKIGDRRFSFPQRWTTLAATLTRYLTVIGSIADVMQIIKRYEAGGGRVLNSAFRVGYYSIWALMLTVLDGWRIFATYWLVPYFTVFFGLLYVRGIAEHLGCRDDGHPVGGTRTVVPFLLERALLCPHNVNYHLEHHLYPGIPFYNLPRLHRALMSGAAFANQAHITYGYSVGLLKEMIKAS